MDVAKTLSFSLYQVKSPITFIKHDGDANLLENKFAAYVIAGLVAEWQTIHRRRTFSNPLQIEIVVRKSEANLPGSDVLLALHMRNDMMTDAVSISGKQRFRCKPRVWHNTRPLSRPDMQRKHVECNSFERHPTVTPKRKKLSFIPH